jgi:hypothetical protein
MKTAQKSLILGVCALLFVSFTLVLAQKSFAEVTLTGTVRNGKLWADKDRSQYTLAGPYGDDVAKLEGKKVSVTGRVDYQNKTIEVTEFKNLGPAM